jgi:hypothetical protein
MLYAIDNDLSLLEDTMSEHLFKDYLISRGLTGEDLDKELRVVKELEEILQKEVPCWTLNDLDQSSVQVFIGTLIDQGKNTPENLYTLLRYAKAINNKPMFNTLFEMLDGCEAMENLFNRLADCVGDELRDIIFEGLPLPPLGLSKQEKARYTFRVVRRMEEVFEERYCREILSDSLRDLPDVYVAEAKSEFIETCQGNIDKYLRFKHQKFIDTLYEHQQGGELFFGQEITDDVIDFVKSNPEIGGGVREGNLIYEIKIPFNTKAYLKEKDPILKRYHYCHCPWVKESIRQCNLTVPATFCQCSAGFHKKPYEVIYERKLHAEVLQSVLKGDPVCRFAINLPEQQN